MKKIVSFILASVISVCSVPVFASENKEKLEKLIVSVKERIMDVSDYEEFSVNERQGSDGKTIYYIDWTDDRDGYKNVHVNVCDDGVITSYNQSNSERLVYAAKIRGTDRKTALEKADKLVDLLNPSIAEELVVSDSNITESLWEDGFSFEVERYVNGIRVPECGGSVTISGDCSKIEHFYLNHYQDAQFEKVDIISQADARKAFMEQIGLQAEYYREYSDDSKAKPVYVFANTEMRIGATDGKSFAPKKSYDGVYYGAEKPTADKAMVSMNAATVGGGALSESEIEELDAVDNLISKDDAVKMIFENPYIPVDKSMPLMSFDVYKYGDGEYNGNFVFGPGYSSVTLNMKNGEVKSFYINLEKKDGKKLTDEQASKLEAEAAKYLAGEKFAEYRKNENNSSYTRYVNNLPFRQDNINIVADKDFGYIRSYSVSYTNCEFVSVDDILSTAEAGEKLFEQKEYDVVYERHISDNNTTFKLIYDFDTSYIRMDAHTGKLENDNEIKKFEGYTDIAGHYAEDIINILAKYGIYTDGGKFTPDEEITQKDFANLLSCIVYRYDYIILKSETSNASALISEGIIPIKSYFADAPLTRLDAGKMLVRAIGGEDYAKLGGIYNKVFSDVNESDLGYAAILFAMGVFRGYEDGSEYPTLRPDDNITYAEAAVMIYNYLIR